MIATQTQRWRTRLAVAVPLTVVLALVVTFALGAVNPSAKADSASRHAHRTRLAALLLAAPVAHHAAIVESGSPRTAPTPGSTVTLSPVGQSHPTATTVSHRGNDHTSSTAEYSREAPERDAVLVPETTVVAHLSRSVPGYSSANALQPNRTVPGTWYGYPSALPVLARTADRLEVRLAQRPDETTTWINKSAAVLTKSHWAIVVDTSQHWLYVFKWGQQVGSFPVGNGAPGTPTPTGTYFIAFHAPPNGPGYGSVMLETSAHSRVIAHFEGGDDAIIAIHGPVGSDYEIGNHGAAISNGCIRMHDWDLRKVAPVRNGSPVFLVG